MANCYFCGEPFNGTPTWYDHTSGERVHVDCDATPPPKARIGVGDPGVGRLPMARLDEVKRFERSKPKRGRNQRGGTQATTSGNYTIDKCGACGRNVQSIDPHLPIGDGYKHRNCDQAAQRMDQAPAKARKRRR